MDIDIDLEMQLKPGQLEAIILEFITRRKCLLDLLTIILMQITQVFYQLLFIPSIRIPHHTSILTGHAWVLELLTGHPRLIKINFGVPLEIFSVLTRILRENGVRDSWHGVTVEEQLGIFLYMCITGLSSRLVASGSNVQWTPLQGK